MASNTWPTMAPSVHSWERPSSPSIISRRSLSVNSAHSKQDLLSGPTLTANSGAEEALEIKSYGSTPGAQMAERLWPSNQQSGGHRTEIKLPRGIYSSPGPEPCGWLEAVQAITQYTFRNPDLLEEALESPGSGVVCVGETHRHFQDGNRGLAMVGEMVMKLVLKDQCYLFKIPEGEIDKIMDGLIGRKNLARISFVSKLEKFVRPKLPLRPTKKKNVFSLVKDDATREDPSRTAARAMRAIIGAIYYDDNGVESARRCMAELHLIIRPGT